MNANRNRHRSNLILRSVSIFFLLLLLSVPLIMNGIYPTGEFSAAWIGFWGSFAGGILGTLGVIFVAYLQDKNQNKHLRIVEKNEKDRLRVTTLISMLQDYHNLLEEFLSKINIIDTKLVTMYARKQTITELNFMVKVHTDRLNEDIIKDKNFLKSTDKNFERSLQRINDHNNIFKGINIDVKDSSTITDRELINGLFIILETFISASSNINQSEHKNDLVFIDQSLENLISYPKDDEGVILPIGIILKPYDELITWLTEEIEMTNKNIISLLNELSTYK